MTRIFQLAITVLALAGVARAEYAGGGQSKWSGFLYGGFAFPSHQYRGGDGTASGLVGVGFGVGLEVKVLPKIAIKLDVLYANKTFEVSSSTRTRYPNTFVEFPVQLKYQPLPWVAIQAGPYLAGLMVSATRESGGAEDAATGRFANDFGMTAGLWFGFRANNVLTIGVDIRYDLGLSDVEHDSFPESKLFTRTILSLMTFTFGF